MNQREVEEIADRAFKSELNRHIEDETEKDRRAESAERRARFMMQKDQEYYPWTFEHFEEAIANALKFERLIVWSCIAKAIRVSLNKPEENEFALSVLQDMVESYWHKLAVQKANKQEGI